MTELEHAIKHIKTRADAWAVKEVTEALQSISERLDKALSQEPCDDAISRDMALEKMADYVASGYADSAEDFEEYSRIICQLPSVTLKPIECDAISRDAVLDAIEHEDKWLLDAKGHNGLTEIAFSGLKARVDALPSVTQSGKWIDGVHAMGYREGYKDAQKQKSGKWIDHSYEEGYVECPFCGHATTCEDNIDELHYCFYCGARMESEE